MSSQEVAQSDEEQAWQATPNRVVLAIDQQAKSFYSEGRLSRARMLYKKLVRMRPEASQFWAMLGIIHRRQDRIVQALQCLQQAVELDSGNRNALVNLGESLVLAGKIEEGTEVLRAVYDMSRVEGKSAQEQDVFTKRAGAQLAILKEIADAVISGEIQVQHKDLGESP